MTDGPIGESRADRYCRKCGNAMGAGVGNCSFCGGPWITDPEDADYPEMAAANAYMSGARAYVVMATVIGVIVAVLLLAFVRH